MSFFSGTGDSMILPDELEELKLRLNLEVDNNITEPFKISTDCVIDEWYEEYQTEISFISTLQEQAEHLTQLLERQQCVIDEYSRVCSEMANSRKQMIKKMRGLANNLTDLELHKLTE